MSEKSFERSLFKLSCWRFSDRSIETRGFDSRERTFEIRFVVKGGHRVLALSCFWTEERKRVFSRASSIPEQSDPSARSSRAGLSKRMSSSSFDSVQCARATARRVTKATSVKRVQRATQLGSRARLTHREPSRKNDTSPMRRLYRNFGPSELSSVIKEERGETTREEGFATQTAREAGGR